MLISSAENMHAMGREKAGALFPFPISSLSSGAMPFDIGSSALHRLLYSQGAGIIADIDHRPCSQPPSYVEMEEKKFKL